MLSKFIPHLQSLQSSGSIIKLDRDRDSFSIVESNGERAGKLLTCTSSETFQLQTKTLHMYTLASIIARLDCKAIGI
jgi:hypothetical protein